jgi:large subunit ribosomal protein L15
VKLHDLRPTPGSRPTSRRVGRGHGSGRGKTAGRGTKGQKSRAGGSLPAWFEGGQTPIHIRTPKLHGFRNRGRVEYAPINLARLGEVPEGTLVTPDVLVHDGLLADTKRPVKVLGNGDAPKGVTIHAHAFSRSAADKLAAAGSTALLISWPDNGPIDEEAKAAKATETAERNRRRHAKRRGGSSQAQAQAQAAAGDGGPRPSAAESGESEPASASVDEADQTGDEGESEPPA